MVTSAPAGCSPAADVPPKALCFAALQNFDLRRLFSRFSLRIDLEESFDPRKRAKARQRMLLLASGEPTSAVWSKWPSDPAALVCLSGGYTRGCGRRNSCGRSH